MGRYPFGYWSSKREGQKAVAELNADEVSQT